MDAGTPSAAWSAALPAASRPLCFRAASRDETRPSGQRCSRRSTFHWLATVARAAADKQRPRHADQTPLRCRRSRGRFRNPTAPRYRIRLIPIISAPAACLLRPCSSWRASGRIHRMPVVEHAVRRQVQDAILRPLARDALRVGLSAGVNADVGGPYTSRSPSTSRRMCGEHGCVHREQRHTGRHRLLPQFA